MRIILIIILSLGLLYSSCSNKIFNTIEGSWSIDTIYFKNYDVKFCLYLNVLNFHKSGEVSLPFSNDRCSEIITKSNDENGDWELIKSNNPYDTIPLQMKITTNNEIFAGTHKVVFYKDELNKLLKMEIWSDSLYILCRKGFYNFDKNIETIKELEKISWTTRPK